MFDITEIINNKSYKVFRYEIFGNETIRRTNNIIY